MSVEHRVEEAEFVVSREGKQAVLKYQLLGDNRIEFVSTYVPFALRGKGLAGQLVEVGLQWARSKDYRISSRCWYVDKFLSP